MSAASIQKAAVRAPFGAPRRLAPKAPVTRPLQPAPSPPPARRRRSGAPLPCRASASVAEDVRHTHGHHNTSSNGYNNGLPTAEVTFRAKRKLKYGQVLKLVGSLKQMGGWDCGKAPAMRWSEGDRWMLTLHLPAGEHEFKVAVAKGSEQHCVLRWEDGPNRTVQVLPEEATSGSSFLIDCDSDDDVSDHLDHRESQGSIGSSDGFSSAAAAEAAAAEAEAAAAAEASGPSLEALLLEEGEHLGEMMALVEEQRAARLLAEAECEELRRQVATGAAEAAALIDNSASLRAEFAQQTRQLEAAEDERDALAGQLAQAEAAQANLTAQLAAAEAARTSLSSKSGTLDKELSWAEQRCASLQAERDGLAADLAAANKALARLQADREGRPQEVQAAAAMAEAVAAERDSLAGQLAEAKRQLEATRVEMARLAETAEKAERNTAVLRSVGLLLASFD